jgi:hypothetical protein
MHCNGLFVSRLAVAGLKRLRPESAFYMWGGIRKNTEGKLEWNDKAKGDGVTERGKRG